MPIISANGFDLCFDSGGMGAPVVYIHGGFASLDTTLHDPASFAWTWGERLRRRLSFHHL